MVDIYVESAIFYNCMREAIQLAGTDLSKEHQIAVKAFAENASDFQILYTAMTNEITEHVATLEEEQALVQIFKESLDLKAISISEGVDFELVDTLAENIRPLAELGLSSKEVMSDGFGVIAERVTLHQLSEDGKAVAAGYEKQAAALQQTAKNHIASAKNALKRGDNKTWQAYLDKSKAATNKSKQLRAKSKEILAQVAKDETPLGAVAKKTRELKRDVKVGATKAGQAVVKTANDVKTKVADTAKKVHGDERVQRAVLNTDQKARELVKDTAEKAKQGKAAATSYGKNLKNIVSKDADEITGAYQKGASGGNDGTTLSKIQQVANGALAAGKALMGTATGQGLAAGAVAGVLAYAGYKTYKRFFSKAAKACAGKSGAEKTACMQQYKNQAIQAQIKDLKSGSTACSKAKDPAKCKAAIQGKIAKLQAKIK